MYNYVLKDHTNETRHYAIPLRITQSFQCFRSIKTDAISGRPIITYQLYCYINFLRHFIVNLCQIMLGLCCTRQTNHCRGRTNHETFKASFAGFRSSCIYIMLRLETAKRITLLWKRPIYSIAVSCQKTLPKPFYVYRYICDQIWNSSFLSVIFITYARLRNLLSRLLVVNATYVAYHENSHIHRLWVLRSTISANVGPVFLVLIAQSNCAL